MVSRSVSSPSSDGTKGSGFTGRQVLGEGRHHGKRAGGGSRVDVEEQMGPANFFNLFSILFLSIILHMPPKGNFPNVSW